MVLCFFLRGFRALAELPRNIHLFTECLCPPAGPRSFPTGTLPVWSWEVTPSWALLSWTLLLQGMDTGKGSCLLPEAEKIHQTSSGSVSKL